MPNPPTSGRPTNAPLDEAGQRRLDILNTSPSRLSLEQLDSASPGTLRTLVGSIRARNQDLADLLDEGEEVLTVVERNARREKRRKAGDKEVSDDEAEGVEGLVENLSAAVAQKASETEKKAKEPTPRIVRARDLKSRFESELGAVPEALMQRWDNRLHILLTALTAEALRKITRSEGLKYTTVASSEGVGTKKVLDTSTFPDETLMSESDFRDGWGNYMRLLRARCDAEMCKRIGAYYTRLTTHREFHLSFPAFLAFDIESRTDFASNPYLFDTELFHELPTFIAKYVAVSAVRSSLPPGHTSQPKPSQLVERQPHRAPSFEPYPPVQVRHASSSSSDLSQQYASSSNSQDGARGSFRDRKIFLGRCLSCGREGHKCTKCIFNISKDGGNLFAVWRGENLVELNNTSARVCMAFNSARGCSHGGPEHANHRCSLCGAADHGAHSTSCRRN